MTKLNDDVEVQRAKCVLYYLNESKPYTKPRVRTLLIEGDLLIRLGFTAVTTTAAASSSESSLLSKLATASTAELASTSAAKLATASSTLESTTAAATASSVRVRLLALEARPSVREVRELAVGALPVIAHGSVRVGRRTLEAGATLGKVGHATAGAVPIRGELTAATVLVSEALAGTATTPASAGIRGLALEALISAGEVLEPARTLPLVIVAVVGSAAEALATARKVSTASGRIRRFALEALATVREVLEAARALPVVRVVRVGVPRLALLAAAHAGVVERVALFALPGGADILVVESAERFALATLAVLHLCAKAGKKRRNRLAQAKLSTLLLTLRQSTIPPHRCDPLQKKENNLAKCLRISLFLSQFDARLRCKTQRLES